MTSPAIEGAARLRRIAQAARAGLPIDPTDGRRFAAAIDRFFAGLAPLDEALGLRASGRGKRNARLELIFADRDDALHALAELVGTKIGDADSEGVWDVSDLLTAFAADKWPKLRTAATCPPGLSRADALCWAILRGRAGKIPPRRWIASFFRGSPRNRISR
ncbi:hypothetical protein [Mesorhizobium sp. M1E.F.Ca.ET.041.01.1.1]|uniref:hypothetical protein n=1 Tax=Mesorhizobium sp. M1E.F.Ca.ET.041.01.1.1 TaxID=2496759 RepID=UPI000FCC25BC|nr:hypothetical protein [Mesorhizobium sp. M1E.F.Ca.ET.041.01.1.1]RUW19605.1 hypothetical protein EOA38_34330 [Mesorhizobium sp. M1E.F.Ca.ET.041.01.1.1]RWD92518.1 MAG: hypothetical protein EOS38_01420 [Mesorhizobium sp.]